jgi:putative Mg2+ transporter-C (MgtC) family protein
MVISSHEMLLRMGVGILFGAVIGYERERSGRPAGLRTHLLVSVASSTFMLVSTQFVYFQNYLHQDPIAVDPSRIAASVVSGVGFLGAGAILRTGFNIQGLTTAASLWLVSAVGLASGAGMFVVGAAATAVSLLGLILLRRVEGKRWRLLQRRVNLVVEGSSADFADVIDRLKSLRVFLSDIDYDLNIKGQVTNLQFDARFQDQKMLDGMLENLKTIPGINQVRIQKAS